jgi:hypothetical protein
MDGEDADGGDTPTANIGGVHTHIHGSGPHSNRPKAGEEDLCAALFNSVFQLVVTVGTLGHVQVYQTQVRRRERRREEEQSEQFRSYF